MNSYIFILLCFLIYRCQQIHEWSAANGVDTHRELKLVNSIENGQFLDFTRHPQSPANFTNPAESPFPFEKPPLIAETLPDDRPLEVPVHLRLHQRAAKLSSNSAKPSAPHEHIDGVLTTIAQVEQIAYGATPVVYGATQGLAATLTSQKRSPGVNNTAFYRGEWHLSHLGDEEMVADVAQGFKLAASFKQNQGAAQVRLKTQEAATSASIVLWQSFQDETVLIAFRLDCEACNETTAFIEKYSQFKRTSRAECPVRASVERSQDPIVLQI